MYRWRCEKAVFSQAEFDAGMQQILAAKGKPVP
jgi:hypothetical protein